jgi:hypothetical protein
MEREVEEIISQHICVDDRRQLQEDVSEEVLFLSQQVQQEPNQQLLQVQRHPENQLLGDSEHPQENQTVHAVNQELQLGERREEAPRAAADRIPDAVLPICPPLLVDPNKEPIELDPRLRRRHMVDLDFNAIIWAMKTLKVMLIMMMSSLLLMTHTPIFSRLPMLLARTCTPLRTCHGSLAIMTYLRSCFVFTLSRSGFLVISGC